MFDIKKNLGVQSYCFRGFKPLGELIAQIKGIGLDRTEVCGVHVNFDDDATFADAIGRFNQAGVAISSIGVQTFKGDVAKEEKWFAFARAAGASMISVNFDVSHVPGVLVSTEKLADKYDLLLGIHNHGGYHWLGSSQMVEQVLSVTGERVGLCLDTAWCLQSGEDPLKWVEQFGKKLFGVHVKDFVFDRAGKWEDVVVGTGNLKLKEFMAAALATPRLAAVTLEYEGDVNGPGPKLKECVDAIRAATA